MIQRNIQVTDEQNAFLKSQRTSFNFSKFVRQELLNYMIFKKGVNLNDKEKYETAR